MTYLSRDNRRRSRQFSWITVAVIIFIILILLIWLFSGFFGTLLNKIGVPVWKATSAVGQSTFWSGFRSKEKLAAENQKLLDEVNRLQAEANLKQTVIDENNSLKEILGRKGNQKLIAATILVWPPQSPYDTMVVDAGVNEGVKSGQMVLAYGNLAVGQIASVSADTSVVRLFSAPGSSNQVIVGTSTKATATGAGGENLQLTLPVGTPINKGDPVLLGGLNPILLGNIEAIEAPPNGSFETLYFKLPVNINTLRMLEIVSK
ncbi:MAG TPA: rod shape-determining protein MreC [Candidatus Paceibacterota bacterium]|nr:rod shape-determining protein MreC [Candidatus Paceibacterota bacterium]